MASVTSDAVFVRFAGHVTGRAGLSQLADALVSDPRTLFSEGQSVRAQVVTVDTDKQRFSVTLRPSLTSSKGDASYLAALFRDLEAAEAMKGGEEAGAVDWSALAVGARVAGHVHGQEEYGLLVDLAAHDVSGAMRGSPWLCCCRGAGLHSWPPVTCCYCPPYQPALQHCSLNSLTNLCGLMDTGPGGRHSAAPGPGRRHARSGRAPDVPRARCVQG